MKGLYPLTQAVGAFAADTTFPMLPEAALRSVRNGVTDCAGVTILGRNEPPTRIARSVLLPRTPEPEARLLFSAHKVAAPDAALVNATSGHAHDFDDTGIGPHPAHPSVVLASAIIAAGETAGASGADMTTAYVVGYEVWYELARRDPQPHNIAGWHPSSVFGPVAAAAAVANLMRLTPGKAAHAVGIAASCASGLIGNFGSMTKPLHVGFAARSGILATRLADAGLTAAPDALEGPFGFLSSYSPEGKVDRESPPQLGKEWRILANGPNIKLYPVCYSIHGAIDAMLDLRGAERFTAGDIVDIKVELTPSQAANLFNHDASDATVAKFSTEFTMASAVVAGRVTMTELSESFLKLADVRNLMAKVRTTVASAGRKCSLTVRLTSGRDLSRAIDTPRGHARQPPTMQDLWSKFSECVANATSADEAKVLFERLQRFDRLASIADLPPVRPHSATGTFENPSCGFVTR